MDSSLVTRVCYNEPSQYMVIRLKNTDYHYCEINAETVAALVSASSGGRHYNAHIKSSANGGRFDCRGKKVPQFS